MEFNQKLQEFRKQKGLTQAQLADLSGIHPVSIRKYEAGMMKPREAQIRKIADVLDVNLFMLHEVDCPKLRLDTDKNVEATIMFLLQIGVLFTENAGDRVSVKLHPAIASFLLK